MSDASKMTVGQVGEKAMKYWPAILFLGLFIAAAAVTNWRVNHNANVLDVLTKKLESKETDKAQWLAIRSLLEDVVQLQSQMKEVEKHITPNAIQKWGEVQKTVQENRELLWKHLFAVEEEE